MQSAQDIISKIAEPTELYKISWLYKAVTLPGTLLTWPLRKIIANAAVPISGFLRSTLYKEGIDVYGKDHNPWVLQPHNFNNKSHRKEICQYLKAQTPQKEKFGLYVRISFHEEENSENDLANLPANRKLMLIFPGNAQPICSAYQEAFHQADPDLDLCFLEYPINPFSVQSLIAAGTIAIKKFIDIGYEPKNIIIYGWSIGGGISCASVREAQDLGLLKANEKFRCYINENSYTRMSTVLAKWLHREEDQIQQIAYYASKAYNNLGARLMSFITKLFNWELDTVQTIEKMPADLIIVSGMKNDEVLGNQASLAKYLLEQEEKLSDFRIADHYSQHPYPHCDTPVLDQLLAGQALSYWAQ